MMKASIRCLGLAALLCVPSAEAVNKEIRAVFMPDSAQPQKNEFINRTPNSGYCAKYPAQCTSNKIFSIQLPVRFESSRSIEIGEQVPLKVPANWRPLTVINRDTQETETVEVRIIGVGSQYVLSHTAAELTGVTDTLAGHRKLWTSSSWVYQPAPCAYSGVGWYGPKNYGFFWKAPTEEFCVKIAAYGIPSMSFDTLDFAYELRTPNPLGMSSGLYTGSMVYRLGPGADFDLGPLMIPDDDNLTLDFVLDVQHTLKVEIPPGGNKVELVPLGGWQGWLQSGRRPVSLFRDQAFNISASSRFKMQVDCQYSSALSDCAIHDLVSRRSVTLQVYVTLPDGLTTMAGEPVRRRRLYGGNDKFQVFKPGQYVDRKPGVLHFEVPQSQMNFMLQPGVQSNYFGYIRVIWDSEV